MTSEVDRKRTDEAAPEIWSVDDHVVEPRTVWSDRMPNRLKEAAPHIERQYLRTSYQGGVFRYEPADPEIEEGTWADCWVYEEQSSPIDRLFASAGVPHDQLKAQAITFDDMRTGCYDPSERLKD